MNLFFVSLGCDKNLVDSEKMIALLASQNISVTSTPEDAEIIIVNTCGFIHDAKEESIETILEMAEYKKTGKCVSLIMTGCLAQRYADDIQKEIPEVDAVVGTTAYDKIFEVVKDTLQGKKECALNDLDYLPKNLTNRVHTSSCYSSYLKIAEGCSKHCTYCIIPKLRGNYRSVPMEELLVEAEQLAKEGTKELNFYRLFVKLMELNGFGYCTVIRKKSQKNWYKRLRQRKKSVIISICRFSTATTIY